MNKFRYVGMGILDLDFGSFRNFFLSKFLLYVPVMGLQFI